jgi:hypothetical protein
MTKDEAKEYLDKWIEGNVYRTNKVNLPINDVIILHKETLHHDGLMEVIEYSFKGLLKIAYDL